jgi:hypothetical protein
MLCVRARTSETIAARGTSLHLLSVLPCCSLWFPRNAARKNREVRIRRANGAGSSAAVKSATAGDDDLFGIVASRVVCLAPIVKKGGGKLGIDRSAGT